MWFDIAGVRDTGAGRLRILRIVVVAVFGIGGLGSAVYVLLREGMSPATLLSLGGCAAFSVMVFCVLMWLQSRERKPAAAEISRLGVGLAGIWCATAQGTSHIPWDGFGGVRIHSIFTNGNVGASRQLIYLGLLAPGHPVTAAESLGLAHSIGAAVRVLRGDLWRGFTMDSGLGYIEFQSWDTPVVSPSENLRKLGAGLQNPTWDNFGGGRFGPPR